MADERDQTSGTVAPVAEAEQRPAALTRRAVLRGATAAVPTILTLKSGAALAVASSANEVTAMVDPEPFDGHYAVLDTTGQRGPVYDYTDGQVWLLPDDGLYVDVSTLDQNQLSALKNGNPLKDVKVLGAHEICTTKEVTYVQVEIGRQGNNDVYVPVKTYTMPKCAYLSSSAFNSIDASKQVMSRFLI